MRGRYPPLPLQVPVDAAACPTHAEDVKPAASVSLYDRLGGKANVEAAVEIFYLRIMADEALAPFFEGVHMARQKQHQVGGWLGPAASGAFILRHSDTWLGGCTARLGFRVC